MTFARQINTVIAKAMLLRYRCLILDHDDTAVNSTATVHYPAHLQAMRVLRPGVRPVDLEGWFLKNFHPGIMPYLKEELGLNESELATEFAIWRDFNLRGLPLFYPGFLETLAEYRAAGGKIAVISHSERDIILGHYRRSGPPALEPDLVFGWDEEESHRKPSPWPVLEALRRFGAGREEALVLDDLKPGVLMAQRAQVAAAGAGWAHCIPKIRRYMESNCVAYFEEPAQFREFLLSSSAYRLPT